MYCKLYGKRLQIFNNYWTRLSKISWFVRGEQINYFPKLSLDLRNTDKSWCFAITEFNNCFIIRSPRMFSYFNHFPAAQGSDLPFFSQKRCSYYSWAEYYLQKNTFRRYYAWADHYLLAVICRSRGGLSANGKEEKTHRMIIKFARSSRPWPKPWRFSR